MKNLELYQLLIGQWQDDYQKLHDILNHEQSALEKRNFEQLSQLTKEKNQLVMKINQHGIPAQLSNSQIKIESIQDLKAHCTGEPKLIQHWQKLMELVSKCGFQNEVNARLVELLSTSTRRTFNLIKGLDPDNNIYNASGTRTTMEYSRASVSA